MQPAVKCGKMDGTTPRMSHLNLIAWCSDLLTERQRWSYFGHPELPVMSPQKYLRKLYNESFIDQACLVKMSGCWPHSFFASLWTLIHLGRAKIELG